MASWPAQAAEQWKTLLAARAIDTQAYVNRRKQEFGTDPNFHITAIAT